MDESQLTENKLTDSVLKNSKAERLVLFKYGKLLGRKVKRYYELSERGIKIFKSLEGWKRPITVWFKECTLEMTET